MLFSFFTGSKKSSATKFFLLCFLLIATFFTTSCKQPTDDSDESIYGVWKSTYSEYFIVDYNSLTNKFNTDIAYAGNNLTIIPATENSGIIIIQYTENKNSEVIGKWYAVAYKNLTSTSVSFSGAYISEGAYEFDTFEEAKKEFTLDSGFFAYYSECIKQ